jgi:hypothetical protein
VTRAADMRPLDPCASCAQAGAGGDVCGTCAAIDRAVAADALGMVTVIGDARSGGDVVVARPIAGDRWSSAIAALARRSARAR